MPTSDINSAHSFPQLLSFCEQRQFDFKMILMILMIFDRAFDNVLQNFF